MRANRALIVGGTGAVGLRITQLLAAAPDWDVSIVSRKMTSRNDGITVINADLTDRNAVAGVLSSSAIFSHIIYAARAPHGEGVLEDVDTNLDMLKHVLQAVKPVAAKNCHVHLVEGAKWYGQHLGAYDTPTREDCPRHMPPNFYYSQQDFLEGWAEENQWSWTASRPNAVCDVVEGRARNLPSTIGAYALICRELGCPMDFPGSDRSFASLTEVTDARLLARGIAFLSTAPDARNRAFNITNGDVFRWSQLWPIIADWFGVPAGGPRPIKLATQMADKADVWQAVRARHDLVAPLEAIANWSYADFIFGQDFDVMSDLIRIRNVGFCEAVDSREMFTAMFGAYRERRIFPNN